MAMFSRVTSAAREQRGFLQMERFLARHTDALVAVSPEVRDELVDLGVGKPSQYLVIPLGLDLDRFSVVGPRGGAPGQLRRALGLSAGTPLAGAVGRLVPVKDHATLFKAWPPPLSFTWRYLATANSGRRWKAWRATWASRDVLISPGGGRTSLRPWPTWMSSSFRAATKGPLWL